MIIGIDLDEVIADSLNSFLEFHNDTYGTSLTRKQFYCYEVWKILGEAPEETIQKFYDFYKTHYFDNVKPVAGSVEGIEKLSKNHKLMVITARPKNISKKTEKWLDKYFTDKFSAIHFTNSYSLQGEEIKKSELCQKLEVDVLIEDSPYNAKECISNKTKIILLDRPWNETEKVKTGISRVYSWKEIADKI